MRRLIIILTVVMSCLCCNTLCCNAMNVSDKGIKFIQEVESCSLTRYWDNDGWSIGYGHHMPVGTKQYKKISKAMAIKLLKQDVKVAENAANRIIKQLKWTPSQDFFDALVSIIYNCGEGGIVKTEFYRRLMNCRSDSGVVHKADYNFTVAAVKNTKIPSGKYKKGVQDRRYKEHKMML